MFNVLSSFLIFLYFIFSSGYSQVTQPELEMTEENYEKLVLGAVGKRWSDVDTMLSKLLIGSGNGRQKEAIGPVLRNVQPAHTLGKLQICRNFRDVTRDYYGEIGRFK